MANVSKTPSFIVKTQLSIFRRKCHETRRKTGRPLAHRNPKLCLHVDFIDFLPIVRRFHGRFHVAPPGDGGKRDETGSQPDDGDDDDRLLRRHARRIQDGICTAS